MELRLDRVSKQYANQMWSVGAKKDRGGNKIAVDRVSVTLHPGVTGLLGANGAGKTTLLRMICGVLKPSSGTISFDDLQVSDEMYRDILGYLPQNFGYYPEFTGRDFLLYMAALKGIQPAAARRKCKKLLAQVNLEHVADKKIRTYSGGMKQRLGIAQAVLNDPKLLILDEPTAGLDPKERVRFRELIRELGRDSIVILSTHIVSDVEHMADRILMMKDGRFIYDGTLADIGMDLEDFDMEEFAEEEDTEK